MMKTTKEITITTAVLLFCLHTQASEQAQVGELQLLQSQWAQATYETDDDQQEDALTALAEKARTVVAARPDNAELLIWKGIIVSSLAGERGGIGALGLAKEAKAALEAALEIQSDALSGSAYTSLGTLYHKVPGWPIGFGSDKKAQLHLKKALAINPDGIDSNFFMAQFLFDDGDYAGAKQHLIKAERAQARPGRSLADSGRHREVAMMLSAVNAKLR